MLNADEKTQLKYFQHVEETEITIFRTGNEYVANIFYTPIPKLEFIYQP